MSGVEKGGWPFVPARDVAEGIESRGMRGEG